MKKHKVLIIGLITAISVVALVTGLSISLTKTKKELNQTKITLKNHKQQINREKQENNSKLKKEQNENKEKQEINNKTNINQEKQTKKVLPNEDNTLMPKILTDVSVSFNADQKLVQIQPESKQYQLSLNLTNLNNKVVKMQIKSVITDENQLQSIWSEPATVSNNQAIFTFDNLDPKITYLIAEIKVANNETNQVFDTVQLSDQTKNKALTLKQKQVHPIASLTPATRLLTYSITSGTADNVIEHYVKQETIAQSSATLTSQTQSTTSSSQTPSIKTGDQIKVGEDIDQYQLKVLLPTSDLIEPSSKWTIELKDTTNKHIKPIVLTATLESNQKELIFIGKFYRVLQKERIYNVVNLKPEKPILNTIFNPDKPYKVFVTKKPATYSVHKDEIRTENNKTFITARISDQEALIDYQGLLTLELVKASSNENTNNDVVIKASAKVDETGNRKAIFVFENLDLNQNYKIKTLKYKTHELQKTNKTDEILMIKNEPTR